MKENNTGVINCSDESPVIVYLHGGAIEGTSLLVADFQEMTRLVG